MSFDNNEELYDFDHVVSRIVEILDLDEWEIEIEREIHWSKVLIEKIIEIHKNNKKFATYLVWDVDSNYYSKFDKELRKDRNLWLVAIKSNSKNYEHLDNKLKKSIDIAQEVIISLVKEWNNFNTIKYFIDTNFSKDDKKLWKFYENHLKKLDIILRDDLVKNIKLIYDNNSESFQLLLTKKIISLERKKVNFNEKFINDFEKSIENTIILDKDFDVKSHEEKNKFYKNFLIKELWLNPSKLDKDILFIIDSILDIYDKILKKKLIKENLNIDDKNNDEKNIDEDANTDNKDNNIEKTDEFSDKLNLYLPNCSYSQSWMWTYNINTYSGLSIKITASEKENFTSLALANFVKFYNILYKLWLNFLWDSYKDKFKWLLTYKAIWFNYLSWKWVDEPKVLEILNFIWKNIWLYQEQILNNNQETTKGFTSFKTFWEAYYAFRKAKISSKINNEYIDTNITIWTVEKKLSNDWKINYATWTFDLTKWK